MEWVRGSGEGGEGTGWDKGGGGEVRRGRGRDGTGWDGACAAALSSSDLSRILLFNRDPSSSSPPEPAPNCPLNAMEGSNAILRRGSSCD